MEENDMNLAIDVMLSYIKERDIQEKTKNELQTKYNFSEEKAEKYADCAFQWWVKVYE